MWQVIGQDKILALLGHSLKEDNIAHAYLLVGPRHVGKRTLALNLAQALNCDEPEPPCGQCHSCHRILEGKHADVTSLGLDSKVEIGIDDIRGLQRLANLPPYEGKCKVFIIDEAEYLSTEAANSLLKILEEPPPKVVWLLLAAEERRLLPTIISRCQRLELKPMPSEQIQQILTDSYNVDLAKAKLLARLCHGCPGWALSALADDDLLCQRSQKIDKLASLLTARLEQRFAYAQELALQFSQDRRSAMEVMETWLSWWHDLMLIKGGYKEAITNVDHEVVLEKQVNRMSLKEIKDFTATLCLTEEDISRNVNARLAFESLMLNMPRKTKIEN
ncbi:MAG: DNA polymerase III subunit delta' [Chloroflexi bacterium CG23_combo_of_CG06-09_8_20_14_all_45_10]|nr:MAG: DNA polymerase III subunit delta' [Chloroflexi bacterium CG23_combo_of_CG06-09_8_20_14_all_45_10]